MPTDEERRRVAAALRECALFDCECEDDGDCFVDCADWGERVLNLLYRDGEDRTEGEYYARLADLIEPGEPKIKCVAEVKIEGGKLDEAVHRAMAEYAGVDRDALLALADKMASFSRDSSCPSCAASGQPECSCGVECRESISHSAARRIREACGEAV